MNWTRFVVFWSCSSFFAPQPLLISFSSEWTEPAIISMWHILYEYFEYHLQNQHLMCILLSIEIYICICVCMFSHYTEFWYCISLTCVNFTGLGPYLSDLIRGTVQPASAVRWLVSGLQSDDKTFKKCQRSHSVRDELQVITQECKASLFAWSDWSKLRAFMQWPLRTRRLLSWVLTSRPQCCHCYYLEVFRGCLIKLTALSLSVCHFFFKSFSWITALIVFFLFFILDSFCPAFWFYFSSIYTHPFTFSSLESALSFHMRHLCFFPRFLIMHYTDSMLGK